ncbi:thioredoxin-like protein CXXS1 isoform X2 [Punica granatum]|uniref:Thioredoxin-like protein CXXS1 isoform X2 n=1 Tax=Punica granatum TaxID=22663 RepID=A0A6P8E135_PUNGR|nr:thioredoxin-like protein CXXS1 isoform X2 [Punica granatum]
MDGAEEQQSKSRVVKIDSAQTWDSYVNQATNEGCPVVVHFSASWCMPSVAMNPIFEELASSYPDVLFLTVDVDDVKTKNRRLCFRRRIRVMAATRFDCYRR